MSLGRTKTTLQYRAFPWSDCTHAPRPPERLTVRVLASKKLLLDWLNPELWRLHTNLGQVHGTTYRQDAMISAGVLNGELCVQTNVFTVYI